MALVVTTVAHAPELIALVPRAEVPLATVIALLLGLQPGAIATVPFELALGEVTQTPTQQPVVGCVVPPSLQRPAVAVLLITKFPAVPPPAYRDWETG